MNNKQVKEPVIKYAEFNLISYTPYCLLIVI